MVLRLIILAYFMNAAIDQECEKYIKEKGLKQKMKKRFLQYIKKKV